MTTAQHLYHSVAFDKREDIDGGHGNYQQSFVEKFSCRAGFTFLRGTESVIAARLEGKQPIVVRVRSSSNTRRIATDWRMRDLRNGSWVGPVGEQYWDGPIYAVQSVIRTEDRRWVDVTVMSGVAA